MLKAVPPRSAMKKECPPSPSIHTVLEGHSQKKKKKAVQAFYTENYST